MRDLSLCRQDGSMQWNYSGYPFIEGVKAVMTSGVVEVAMISPPQLPVIRMGSHVAPNTIVRPTLHAKWRITSEVGDDLKRFVAGKYWHRIEAKLLADFLRNHGAIAAADVYDRLAIWGMGDNSDDLHP